jgi:hypothetical protein
MQASSSLEHFSLSQEKLQELAKDVRFPYLLEKYNSDTLPWNDLADICMSSSGPFADTINNGIIHARLSFTSGTIRDQVLGIDEPHIMRSWHDFLKRSTRFTNKIKFVLEFEMFSFTTDDGVLKCRPICMRNLSDAFLGLPRDQCRLIIAKPAGAADRANFEDNLNNYCSFTTFCHLFAADVTEVDAFHYHLKKHPEHSGMQQKPEVIYWITHSLGVRPV